MRKGIPAVTIAAETSDGGWRFALEDLDASGFPERRGRVSHEEVDRCLAWLAAFHASFLGASPTGLWEEGTYWHLGTRPDELDAMASGPLRDAAPALDYKNAAGAPESFQRVAKGYLAASAVVFCDSCQGGTSMGEY